MNTPTKDLITTYARSFGLKDYWETKAKYRGYHTRKVSEWQTQGFESIYPKR